MTKKDDTMNDVAQGNTLRVDDLTDILQAHLDLLPEDMYGLKDKINKKAKQSVVVKDDKVYVVHTYSRKIKNTQEEKERFAVDLAFRLSTLKGHIDSFLLPLAGLDIHVDPAEVLKEGDNVKNYMIYSLPMIDISVTQKIDLSEYEI